jgi:DNA polymerase III subunit gamma/tau
MDAASNNSVDDIRDLREKVAYAPISGRHKVYILDEAHMLSSQAWNAFLKTLEEPPPRTIFVLATTEAQKVLPTVVDRCHRFDFGRPSVEQVATVLERVVDSEGIEIDAGAVALVARHATGSFRDALGTLEQLVTYAGGQRIEPADVLAVLGIADSEQLFAAVDAIVAANPATALRAANTLAESGRDSGQVLRDLEAHARELLTVQVLGEVPDELRVTVDRDRRLADQAQALPRIGAVRLLDLVAQALDATANGAQARIQLELVLIKAADPEVDPSTTALLARIERLEEGLRSAPAAPPPTGAPAPAPAAPPEPDPEAAVRPPEAAPVAPEPAHPTPESAAPVTEALGLDAAISSWPAVLELVRGENLMLASALEAARPVSVGERELTLAFPDGASFLKRKAEQDDHRRVAVEALRTVTGHRVALRYELREDEEDAEPVTEPALSGEELVRRFMEEFDAEELPGEDTSQHEGEASG